MMPGASCGKSRTRSTPGRSSARSNFFASSCPTTSARDFARRSTRLLICRWSARPTRFGVRQNWDHATFPTLKSLQMAYDVRLMYEAALPVLDRLAALRTTNTTQVKEQEKNRSTRAEYVRKLGPAPAIAWRNLSELDQIVTTQLAAGRAASAADLLEEAYPPEKAPWEIVDKIATLRLHLGEPARARKLWDKRPRFPGRRSKTRESVRLT